jgi:hypothetical protein
MKRFRQAAADARGAARDEDGVLGQLHDLFSRFVRVEVVF